MPRATKWFETIQGFVNVAAGAQGSNDLLFNLDDANRRMATVTRMIIDLAMHPAAVTTIHELFWGITVETGEQFLAGVHPETDVVSDADWLIHGKLYSRSSDLSDSSQDDRVRLDIRAQRVLRGRRDTLVLVVDDSGSGVSYSAFMRVLMRLP